MDRCRSLNGRAFLGKTGINPVSPRGGRQWARVRISGLLAPPVRLLKDEADFGQFIGMLARRPSFHQLEDRLVLPHVDAFASQPRHPSGCPAAVFTRASQLLGSSASSPPIFCADSASAPRATTTRAKGKRSAYSAPKASSPPSARLPTDARSRSAKPASPLMNKNASTKCSESTGNPPSRQEKLKSQREEIVVPLGRPPRFHAGLRSAVRNLGWATERS